MKAKKQPKLGLRPLQEQVVVITGASSGIGRLAARRFGGHGAKVVLAARQQDALQQAASEVEQAGGQAEVVVTDVVDWGQVQRLASQAVARFGRIDTWINNAGINVVGRFTDLEVEEIQRALQVNLMGQVYGAKAALPYMIEQGRGSIINMAAAAAIRSVPLQVPYSMSMHGVKGYDESLRQELAIEHPEINLCLIMPASVNTPFLLNARSKLGEEVRPNRPIFSPEAVVQVILACATSYRRDVFVGVWGEMLEVINTVDPSLLDWYTSRRRRGYRQQESEHAGSGEDNLFAPLPVDRYSVTGLWTAEAKSGTIYSRFFQLHPNLERVIGGTMLLAVLTATHMLARRLGR